MSFVAFVFPSAATCACWFCVIHTSRLSATAVFAPWPLRQRHACCAQCSAVCGNACLLLLTILIVAATLCLLCPSAPSAVMTTCCSVCSDVTTAVAASDAAVSLQRRSRSLHHGGDRCGNDSPALIQVGIHHAPPHAGAISAAEVRVGHIMCILSDRFMRVPCLA